MSAFATPALPGLSRQRPLSRKAKAAIVVQFLLQEGAEVPLSALPEDLQAELTQQLGAMRYVDRETLRTVMDEFAEELDGIGLRFPGGLAGALNALEGKVNPTLTRRIRKETGARRFGDPWERVGALSLERLVAFAEAESIEVAAVLISKLEVSKAAALLGRLPGDRARRITYAVSMTTNVTPEAVERTRAFMAECGQAPIVMQRELDGFIMNRMQGALLEEAFRLVADGYASVEDVDIGIREGLALRWSFMGPFETIDLNAPGGVRDYVERYQSIYERISPTQWRRVDWAGEVLDEVEADRRARLPADRLGDRQAWRDRRLMALAAHKRKAGREIGD